MQKPLAGPGPSKDPNYLDQTSPLGSKVHLCEELGQGNPEGQSLRSCRAENPAPKQLWVGKGLL